MPRKPKRPAIPNPTGSASAPQVKSFAPPTSASSSLAVSTQATTTAAAPSVPPGAGFPSDQAVAFYKLYRDQIVCEDNLINYRMSWFLLLETILATVWGTISSTTDPSRKVYVTGFVCLLGIAGCFSISSGVSAAQAAILFLKTRFEDQNPDKPPDPRLPLIVGDEDHHRKGKRPQRVIIGLVGLGWLCVLVTQVGELGRVLYSFWIWLRPFLVYARTFLDGSG